MNYTYATVIISDADKAQAQADMGEGFFNTPLSATGEKPATNWMSSGPFANEELDRICNEGEGAFAWKYKIAFGQDWQGFVDYLGLKVVYPTQELQTN